jgi:putative hemolysin
MGSSFPIVEILVIFVLILINGFFSASEIAIVSARRSRLQQQADAGKKGARQAIYLAENTDLFLATVQIGITLISTLASAFGGASISEILAQWLQSIPVLAPYAHSIALGLVVLALTYFSLVLGELVPKRLALQSAEAMSTKVAPFMIMVSIVARPVVSILTFSTSILLRLLGRNTTEQAPITQEDIVYLAREGAISGTVETKEEELISRVFRFTDRTVGNIMLPRTEIVAIEVGTPLAEVRETFLTSGYTRLPLYEDSLDNIVGILYAKDLLREHPRNGNQEVDLRSIARQAFFVSEFQHIDDLLATFRRQRIHMAIVIDEYSQVVGLVTLEDILEELVGEIQDEYDQPEDNEIVQREDGSWLVDAMVNQEEMREKLGMEQQPPEERGDYHTLAGMILEHIGHIPKVGETFTIGSFVFEIVDMDGHRIDKVLIRRADSAQT